jgi:ornithine cyclodeaminase/alanine dehydrogenase-like protein (mu-crystallin family)
MRFIDREEIARPLTYPAAIRTVRVAMIALSRGETKQLLRSLLTLSEGRLYGAMTGALGAHGPFGSKMLSVFQENTARGRQSHQGLVLVFDPESGAPVCALHAGELTAIRTAAASAVATDALARKDSRTLAILGCGEQAATHLRAVREVRPLEGVTVWGRSRERAIDFARGMEAEVRLPETSG